MGLFSFLRIIINMVWADRAMLPAENLALSQKAVACCGDKPSIAEQSCYVGDSFWSAHLKSEGCIPLISVLLPS